MTERQTPDFCSVSLSKLGLWLLVVTAPGDLDEATKEQLRKYFGSVHSAPWWLSRVRIQKEGYPNNQKYPEMRYQPERSYIYPNSQDHPKERISTRMGLNWVWLTNHSQRTRGKSTATRWREHSFLWILATQLLSVLTNPFCWFSSDSVDDIVIVWQWASSAPQRLSSSSPVCKAMHTLFRSISDGLGWDVVVRPLVQAGWFWGSSAAELKIWEIQKVHLNKLLFLVKNP